MKEIFIKNKNYYITLFTGNKEICLTEYAGLLQRCFKTAQQYYSFKLNAIVILPDHIHFMITVQDIEEIPEIIRNIKRSFTTWYNQEAAENGKMPYSKDCSERRPWKKGYDIHLIQDEDDLKYYLDYIHFNPVKHEYVDSPKDWNYSSYKSYAALGVSTIDRTM